MISFKSVFIETEEIIKHFLELIYTFRKHLKHQQNIDKPIFLLIFYLNKF